MRVVPSAHPMAWTPLQRFCKRQNLNTYLKVGYLYFIPDIFCIVHDFVTRCFRELLIEEKCFNFCVKTKVVEGYLKSTLSVVEFIIDWAFGKLHHDNNVLLALYFPGKFLMYQVMKVLLLNESTFSPPPALHRGVGFHASAYLPASTRRNWQA